MGENLLQGTLGHALADAAVQEVIRVYEDAFPDQVAGYYVEGSYAIGLQEQLPLDDEEVKTTLQMIQQRDS